MCGIAGIVRTQDPRRGVLAPRDAIPEAWLDMLDRRIVHRGPDGQGRFRDRVIRDDGVVVDVALVHRRLAIIDLSDQAAQPMATLGMGGAGLAPDERHGHAATLSRDGAGYESLTAHSCPGCEGLTCVVLNGCIYNHKDLRAELLSLGHEFFTDHSDTEVLVHAWCQWGDAMQDRVEGMYAIAIWSERDGSLSILRDPAGQKPIYLMGDRAIAAFSSDAPSLHVLCKRAGLDARLDPGAIAEWIAMGYDALRTPFAQVRQAPPASVMRWTADQWHPARRRPMASPPTRSFGELLSLDRGAGDAISRVERAIDASVARHLDADVPVACFLSGGVDSSLVAHAAMRRLGSISTICVRMASPEYDESRFAAIAARAIGSDHHEIDPSKEPAHDLRTLIESLGLPFGDSSLLPTHWASRAARSICGVALSGDGGDEMFLGYDRYLGAQHLVSLWALGVALAPMHASILPRGNPRSRADRMSRLLAGASKRSYRSLLAIFQHPDLNRLIPGVGVPWNDAARTVRRAQAYDLEHHLPGDMLRKVDHASMACGLEVRAPLLDSIVAETALSMPTDRLLASGPSTIRSGRTTKGLLKRVALKHFPAEIVNRPKRGFAIPIGEWFRTDFAGMRQLLHDHLESSDPFPGLGEAGVEIELQSVRRMLREHDAAGARSLNPWHGRDHAQRLYMLLVLSIWCRWLKNLV